MLAKTPRKRQSATVLPVVFLWIFVGLFLGLLVLQEAVPYETLLLDPNRSGVTPWYAGLLWGFGLLGWTVATVSALASAWICRLAGRTSPAKMLATGALLSALFLVDDLLQLGDRIGALFNIPSAAFSFLAIAACTVWVVVERSELQRTRIELVATAIAALVCSVVMLSIAPSIFGVDQQRAVIAASAAEFLAVLSWAQYFVLTGADIVRSIFMNFRAKQSVEQSQETEQRPDLGEPTATVKLTPRPKAKEPVSTQPSTALAE